MGPLKGLKVVEFAGIGPTPMCAMLLADLGATVLRIDRPTPAGLGVPKPLKYDLLLRNRSSITVDLKAGTGVALALDLAARADVLIEGFRPGTMERMGLGPDACLQRNGRLVYGRMTGWGQDGPLARTAGHDLNYIGLSGALHAIGRQGHAPTPPLNLVGDFGGGAVALAFGLLAAVLSARDTGRGQVVDAAMSEGSAMLMTAFFGLHAAGMYGEERGTNMLDSGAPYYDVYECADGQYLAVAPIEAKFRRQLFDRLGIAGGELDAGPDRWPALRETISERFRTQPRAHWLSLFDGSDACVTPVLSMAQAPSHPHNLARGAFVEVEGVVQPAPVPRFSATPCSLPRAPRANDADIPDALGQWGFGPDAIQALQACGTLAAGKTEEKRDA